MYFFGFACFFIVRFVCSGPTRTSFVSMSDRNRYNETRRKFQLIRTRQNPLDRVILRDESGGFISISERYPVLLHLFLRGVAVPGRYEMPHRNSLNAINTTRGAFPWTLSNMTPLETLGQHELTGKSLSFSCKNLFIEAPIIMRIKVYSIHVSFLKNHANEDFNKKEKTIFERGKNQSINILKNIKYPI